MGNGGVAEVKTKLKQFYSEFERFFCPKIGEDQRKEKEKKKTLSRLGSISVTDSLPVQSQNGHILMDNANGGGAIFAFGAKIGLEQVRSQEFALGAVLEAGNNIEQS